MKGYGRRIQLAQAVTVISILALLEVAPRLGWVDRLTLVPLSEMAIELATSVTEASVLHHLWVSASSIFLSFGLAVVGGVAVGYLLFSLPKVFELVSPYLVSYYAIPFFAFYPLFVLLFGANRIPVVIIGTTWAMPAIILPTVEGLRKGHEVWEKVGAIYHLNKWDKVWQLRLPGALPHILPGVRLAVTYSILAVIVSEFILSSEGLGWLISYHFNNFGLAEMWAAVLLVVVLSLTLNAIVRLIVRYGVRIVVDHQ